MKYSSPLNTASAAVRYVLAVKSDKLLQIYLENGPEVLKERLNVGSERGWMTVFDYLAFEVGAMKRCAVLYRDFFVRMVQLEGPQKMREVLQLEGSQYDLVFEEIFDFICVGNGALFDYVRLNIDEFSQRVRQGNAGSLQRELGLNGKKYHAVWFEVLEMLMNEVCTDFYDERQAESGLKSFSLLMNGLREQRSLRSSFGKLGVG